MRQGQKGRAVVTAVSAAPHLLGDQTLFRIFLRVFFVSLFFERLTDFFVIVMVR